MVQISAHGDHILVVYHDGHAGCGGPRLAELKYTELCDRLGHVVPRVDEVMALLAGRLIGHLDLKETGYEKSVVALASSVLGPGNFVVTTLEDASVATIKRAFPEVRTALSLGRSAHRCPRHQPPGPRGTPPGRAGTERQPGRI